MELICPSCEARYQLPEGSITARGRQVSCMNCGHSWHALPPMALEDPIQVGPAKAPSDSRGIQYVPPAGAPRPGENRVQESPYAELGGGTGPIPAPAAAVTPPPAAPAAAPTQERRAAPVEAAGSGGAAAAESPRNQQMAEIRNMLAEVQSEERTRGSRSDSEKTQIVAPAAAATVSGISPAADEAERARARLQEERELAERAARKAEQAEAEARDTERDFRRRIENRSEKQKAKPTDVKRLKRRHDRKIARHRHASKAGSGAFLTGFLLIAIIAATMVSMYRLEPQIVARMPSAQEPMREYVATMDRLRAGASETVGNVQEWIKKKLGDKNEEG